MSREDKHTSLLARLDLKKMISDCTVLYLW